MPENLAPLWGIFPKYSTKPSYLHKHQILLSDIPLYEKNISKIIYISTDYHAIQLNKTWCFHFPTPLSPPASSYIKKKKKQHSNNPKRSEIQLSLKVWEGLAGRGREVWKKRRDVALNKTGQKISNPLQSISHNIATELHT